jgi:hypothetical protein
MDLSKYALKTDIPAAMDLSAYAKKAEIPAIPAAMDLSKYALKTDIPAAANLAEYAKKTDLNAAISKGMQFIYPTGPMPAGFKDCQLRVLNGQTGQYTDMPNIFIMATGDLRLGARCIEKL